MDHATSEDSYSTLRSRNLIELGQRLEMLVGTGDEAKLLLCCYAEMISVAPEIRYDPSISTTTAGDPSMELESTHVLPIIQNLVALSSAAGSVALRLACRSMSWTVTAHCNDSVG